MVADTSLEILMRLDKKVDDFIDKSINNFVKWEILRFLHKHHDNFLDVNDLVEKIKRSEEQIISEITSMCQQGIISRKNEDGKDYYSYKLSSDDNKELEMKSLVNKLIDICKTRRGRLQMIYKLLKTNNS